jgi:hypothetical protein
VRRIIAAVAAGILFVSAAVAHHSVAGEFDVRKTVTLNGVVSKVDWVNPHIYIWLAVKSAGGKVDPWHLECVPVGMARKARG